MMLSLPPRSFSRWMPRLNLMYASSNQLLKKRNATKAHSPSSSCRQSISHRRGAARAVGLLLAADDDPLFLQIKAARFCGRCLARAHAQSGDAATISGYMGSRGIFDNAIGEFAV